jgi:hypothetical protein
VAAQDADGPQAAPALILVYNIFGATNVRSSRYSPLPPSNMSLSEIFTAPFGLVPALLEGRLPTAVLAHATFWDLLVACDALTEAGYAELTKDPEGSAAQAWLTRFSEGVGELLDAVEALTAAWPVSLRTWRTANLVNEVSFPDTGTRPVAHSARTHAHAPEPQSGPPARSLTVTHAGDGLLAPKRKRPHPTFKRGGGRCGAPARLVGV